MKRREFLEVTAAAAGATRLAAPFAGVRVPPSDTVRFGMIGVGMQGSGLLGAATSLPGVTCAGAADLYDGRHILAKEIVGPNPPATREYRRLLDDKIRLHRRRGARPLAPDRKSTRLNSSHGYISYAV